MQKLLALGLAVMLAAACADSLTEPTADPLAPAFSAGLGRVVQSATGSGHYYTAPGELRTFSFTARRYADGTVKGEWQQLNREVEVKAHGNVTCFTIIGNQVWLGGDAERSNDAPGGVAWRAVDNGQGSKSPPDRISQKFFGQSPAFVADYCATTPDSPLLNDIDAGNIQIRG